MDKNIGSYLLPEINEKRWDELIKHDSLCVRFYIELENYNGVGHVEYYGCDNIPKKWDDLKDYCLVSCIDEYKNPVEVEIYNAKLESIAVFDNEEWQVIPFCFENNIVYL